MSRRIRALLLILAVGSVYGCIARGSPPLVKIGLVAPFEGDYRPLGYDALNGVRMAVRERNAEGGGLGRRVEVVALDDHGEPSEARRQAAELALDPLIFGAIGHLRDETTAAAATVYSQAGLALVTLGAPSLVSVPSVDGQARLGPAEDEIFDVMLHHAVALDVRRAAVVSGSETLLDLAIAPAGLELVPFPGPHALLSSGFEGDGVWDAVLFLGSDEDGAGLLVALREAGWNGAFLGGPALESPVFAGWAGPFAANVFYFSGSYRVSEPDFDALHRELAGSGPGPWAGAAYDAARLLLDGLEEAIQQNGALSREGVVQALVGAELDGITGGTALNGRGAGSGAPVTIYRFTGSYPGTPLAASDIGSAVESRWAES
ncbi:MAG: branched-chain amino acid ABC transporter substrate-binding protein [Anaerolineae bacterium]